MVGDAEDQQERVQQVVIVSTSGLPVLKLNHHLLYCDMGKL